MNILVLCEGDAESRDSWSGITNSVVMQLRADGHTVRTGDVDLSGLQRWLAAAHTFNPDRQRWSVRFRLGGDPFRRRSRLATRWIRQQPRKPDLILQVGATFEIGAQHGVPYVLYCDSNIRMAEHGRASGFSHAVHLGPAELQAVRAREQRVYDGAAAIFTISERLRRSFIEDIGAPPDRVVAVHAGPNFDVDSIGDTRRAARGNRPPTILFVGRQFERKGGDIVLAAFETVRTRIPDARLIIIGPERLDIDVPGVESLGFLNKDIPAERERLLDAYRSADVFCLPTRFEPFGIVFLEAMFFGLPCVGTDAWAVPEMITDGVTGFTVPVGETSALADRLVFLLENPAEAARMGAAAAHRARTEFTWRAVVDRMMEKIDSLVPQGVRHR
jgi:glycosyltransferase involved in cell wall biosynthesis